MSEEEQPQQTYYPGAKCKIAVRFEEFGAHDPPAPPDKPSTLRKGKAGKSEGSLTIQNVDGKLVLAAPGESKTIVGNPQGAASSSDGRTFSLAGVIPVKASIVHNGIRAASTASIDLLFADFPFDPRLVRSAAIELYFGTISPSDFQAGLEGGTRATKSGLEPLNMIPDKYVDEKGAQRTNLRFQGWADEISCNFEEDAVPVVHIECRDNTTLVIDTDAPPKLTIDPEQPIDLGVATYLANFPQFRGLSVEFRPAGTEVPIPKAALAKTAFAPQLGPSPAGSGKLAVWDYITDFVGQLGFIVRFEGTSIVIQRARTLYGGKFAGRPEDPFVGRSLPSGKKLTARLFLYGRNVQRLGFKRKMTKWQTNNIECRCYSGKQKKTLVARYPIEKDDRQSSPLPGDQTDNKWKVRYVQGIEDEATLRRVAQGLYEAMGRTELEANFDTKSLASFGAGNLDPDMLDCLPGDTIEVEIQRERTASTIMTMEADRAAKARSFLEQLGYGSDVAAAYERAANNIGFPTIFRAKRIGMEWDSEEDGISLGIETCNYQEARMDKELPSSEEGAGSSTTKAPSKKGVGP